MALHWIGSSKHYSRTSLQRTPTGPGPSVRWGGVRSFTGDPSEFVVGEVFTHKLTGKMFGTGQNRSFKWGVRLTRVFVRRGPTVFWCHFQRWSRFLLNMIVKEKNGSTLQSGTVFENSSWVEMFWLQFFSECATKNRHFWYILPNSFEAQNMPGGLFLASYL